MQVLILLVCLVAMPSEDVSYVFQSELKSPVNYEGEFWFITAKLEQVHCENDKVYPYYRLSRLRGNKMFHVWVWAVLIDKPSDLGSDPIPECPPPMQPPC